MTAPRGVHHVAIKVRDLASVEPFYRDLLGLPVIKRWLDTDGQNERAIWVDAGDGGFVALEVAKSGGSKRPGSEEQPGLFFLALRIGTGDRGYWEQRFAAAGVAVYHRTNFTIYVRDPEGNRIALSHYPEKADEKR